MEQITSELVKILEAPRTIRAVPIGLLTTQKRDVWAMARETLKQGKYFLFPFLGHSTNIQATYCTNFNTKSIQFSFFFF